MAIRTVSDLKRATPAGTAVHVQNLAHPQLSGRRVIMKAQSTKWAMTFPESHPKYVAPEAITSVNRQCSWLDHPKAMESVVDSAGAVTFYRDSIPWLVMTVLPSTSDDSPTTSSRELTR